VESPRRATPSERGFTLLEIMVVMLIAGMMMSSAVVGFSAVRRGRLRAGAAHLASAMRFAYVHALSTGASTRLVLPMNANRVWIEDTEDAHVLDPQRPPAPRRRGAAGDAEAAAAEEAARDGRGADHPSCARAMPRARSSPAREGQRFRERSLEDGVVVARVYAQHEEEPRRRATGTSISSRRGGERAVVHLRGADGEIYSVTLTALRPHADHRPRGRAPSPRRRDATRRPQRDRPARAAHPKQEAEP
jgi:prepilin-type N-terminal cleavage/methylation domain-containing protein